MATLNTSLHPVNEFNLETFFEASPDLICIAGYDGYFKKINPSVSRTLGYTAEELMARPINSFVHPDDQEITARSRENIINNKPLLNFDNRYVTKSGEIIWLHWTSVPMESERVVFAIAKNITHKKKLEDDRNQLLTNLTRVNNDLKQLSFTITHDLRTPVSNLLSIFYLMDTTTIQNEETLSYIKLLKSSAENLRDTLNNYVDILNQRETINNLIEEVDFQTCLDKVLISLKSLLKSS